ncbi:Coenzyme A disulfide reductase [Blautia producta]|uniref:Coenzyme A disulfide reductase n=1 Tax=Blautia producta TaxID=33035 RepID=A0A4P6M229_9FIRM|nr:DsrE/DsrF/DrsH-like family protein [Blautia producta]QBE99114.1 Coenzyme A disulfide reductase [Blautia producta]
MSKKTVIIGGVAGGATAAARLRRRDEKMEIVVLEKGDYISFANCGLPYYIGDVIKSRDALLLQTPEAMKKKFNIEVRTRAEAVAVHPKEHKVSVRDLSTGAKYEESYDNLIIATGSSPIKPPIPGIDGQGIFTLWNIPDTDKIKNYMEQHRPGRAAVIGGGFIGLEMAENLHGAGLDVTIIEMQNQVMAPLDYEMAQILHENIRMNNTELILEDGVDHFETQNGSTRIHLKSGRTVEAEMVLLSIGVKPNSSLAKTAGLSLNARGGVQVDEYLRTSEPDIYAVGDVIEVNHLVTGEKTMIPLAGPANKQARICADNITGSQKTYQGSMGTSVAQVFDLTAAAVGLNEKALLASGRKKGTDYETVVINQKSHAGYYPQATPITLKLLFEKEGMILGAQAVGQDKVDKRIDTIATVMSMGGTTENLAKLELAYAPPFSSAKDPVNMLGFVAENILNKMVSFVTPAELDLLLDTEEGSITVLDVTEDAERMVFSIPGSVHIPLGMLRDRLGELNPDKKIITYCSIGVRSYNAARILAQNGFRNVSVLAGGTSFYKTYHHTVSGQMPPAFSSVKEKSPAPEKTADKTPQKIQILDCSGLQCPGPIMKVNETLKQMQEGARLQVSATDMGFARDIDAWCQRTGNTLLSTERQGKENIVTIQKGSASADSDFSESSPSVSAASCFSAGQGNQGKTIIVFDGDLDKVLASFIIANGAAAMGRPVTMFFTFWGLNALRKPRKVRVKKPFVEKMFGFMMPRGTTKLKLSKMNMLGMGTKMMKKVMKSKNVSSLEELIEQALANGVKLVACTMSMDVMGITPEELIDGVELAGVASYLGDAEQSNVNLFV